MAGNPRHPQEEGHFPCPYCTIQIPAKTTACPHCDQVVSSPERPRIPVPFPAGAPDVSRLWKSHGRWIAAGGSVLLAIVVLLLGARHVTRYSVRVVPNDSLPVSVEKEREGSRLILRGTVTNRGEDVPDLSLRSVGIVAEFVYRDGRRERKTVFPKADFRGEGALLHGETGKFRLESEEEGLKEIVLRSEIVDLGSEKALIPPRGR